jgi:hypothetical protein
MLKCLDSRAQRASTRSNSKAKGGSATLSPTLHRYANVTKKRDLSQYLKDEKKKGKAVVGNGARGITPLYTAVAQNGGLVHGAANPPNPGTNAAPDDAKKPFFRAFEHPFVLIDDIALLHAPIWKEYGPEALKSSKSGEPFPVLHWTCPLGYCPFVLPPATAMAPSPQAVAGKGSRGVTTRSKAAALDAHLTRIPEYSRPSKSRLQQIVQQQQQQQQHQHQQQHQAFPQPKPVQRGKGKRASALSANRARPGYCECCYERYSDLSKHISSLFHRQFALEDKNYAELDKLLGVLMREPTVKVVLEEEVDTSSSKALLRSPISQKSTDCAASSAGRNYTASKRAKQTMALKQFKPQNNDDADADKENNNWDVPTSPSCKRHRSNRLQPQGEPVRLDL